MSAPDFNSVVEVICKEDPRFDRKAYAFVRDGLGHTMKELEKKDRARFRSTKDDKDKHVTGPELLHGLRAHALDQFGPLAKTVLNAWGVRRCADFGEIVFNLIECRWFKKTDTDRREDFSEVYTFDDAFVKPFQPRSPSRVRATTSPTIAVTAKAEPA